MVDGLNPFDLARFTCLWSSAVAVISPVDFAFVLFFFDGGALISLPTFLQTNGSLAFQSDLLLLRVVPFLL